MRQLHYYNVNLKLSYDTVFAAAPSGMLPTDVPVNELFPDVPLVVMMFSVQNLEMLIVGSKYFFI